MLTADHSTKQWCSTTTIAGLTFGSALQQQEGHRDVTPEARDVQRR
jgi:hypothetical protein